MGAELAKLVMHSHAGLSGNAFKVLTRMAWTALDRPSGDGRPARLYFGGWEPLAIALGNDVPDASDPAARGRRKKLQDYVGRALQEIERAGAIKRLEDHPKAGRRQTFELTLDLASAPPIEGGSSTPETGGLSTPERGGLQPPEKRGESTPILGGPRKEQDPTEDSPQDHQAKTTQLPHGGRQGRPEPHIFQPDAENDPEHDCLWCTLPPNNRVHLARVA